MTFEKLFLTMQVQVGYMGMNRYGMEGTGRKYE